MRQSTITCFGCLFQVGRVELATSLSLESDGWLVSFDIYLTGTYPCGGSWEKRKVPSDDLRLLVSYALNIETRLEGHEVYPSLFGRLPERPDASEFFGKVEAMLMTADMEALWREPNE